MSYETLHGSTEFAYHTITVARAWPSKLEVSSSNPAVSKLVGCGYTHCAMAVYGNISTLNQIFISFLILISLYCQ